MLFQIPEEPRHNPNIGRPNIVTEKQPGLGQRGVDYLDLLV